MPGSKFSEQHRVLYYETNVTQQINIGQMVNLMILVSENQGDQLGLTSQVIAEHGCGWVITQHLLEIERLPRKDEVITITTQAQSSNPFFCYRDFWIHDQAGNLLVKMHSVFVLMDLKTRKMIRIIPELVTAYGAEMSKKVERLPIPATLSTVSHQQEYRVRFMDIDSNYHVNNVHYFDWMLDCLDKDFLMQHRLVKMNIQYKQEIHYGQTPVSQVWQATATQTHHQIMVADQICCVAQCEWQKNENNI